MSFFRSDPLGHYKLIIPRENAWHIMNLLGQLDMIHFVKSSKPIDHNPYLPQIKRCQQSLHKVQSMERVLWQKRLYSPTIYFTQKQFKQLLKQISRKHHDLQKQKSSSILNQVEAEVDQNWEIYTGMKKRHSSLLENVQFYRENIAIIIAGQRMFSIQRLTRSVPSTGQQGYFGQVYDNQGVLRINYGIIDKAEQLMFQRSIFRITRGHSYVQFISFKDIFQEVSQAEQNKSVYFIIFQGMKNSYMQKKLLKISQPYNQVFGKAYQVPSNKEEQTRIIKELTQSFNESSGLLKMVEEQIDNFMRKILLGYDQRKPFQRSNSKEIQIQSKYTKIEMAKVYLLKQLEIFNHLKEMDVYDNFLQAEIYLRFTEFQALKHQLMEFEKQTRHPSIHIIPIDSAPGRSSKKPTLFQGNSYTRSAQQIVGTYGTARYREANPSLFTTVTFPFLFGVMFGDIGHGLMLFFFGLLMIFQKYKLAEISDIFIIVVPHRYLFAMMGFFSTYCGFIYNDFLSINLNLFGSCYDLSNVQEHQPILRDQSCIYPFGVDPVWGVAQNNLNYINSLKMKISVIIGVIHMTVGVIIKATNSLYFKRKVQFWFETIPQLIFLVLVFGYMDFLIIFKWLRPWGYWNNHAPSIITSMINLPLMLGKTDKQCCHGGEPMWGDTGNTSQDGIQKVILVIVFLCVPIMLLVKPIYQIHQHKKQHNKDQHHQLNSTEQESQSDGYSIFADEQDEQVVIENIKSPYKETSFKSQRQMLRDMDGPNLSQSHQPSEIFVHQMIQTIQFVLGCISNTASYLRLWALSLAHSQLAEVFMEKTLVSQLENGYAGIAGMIIFFPLFAAATFGVLMCMDVMECFLHTLRLHWVEFQNKFYKGDGYPFQAFSFLEKINTQIRKTKLQGQPEHPKQ